MYGSLWVLCFNKVVGSTVTTSFAVTSIMSGNFGNQCGGIFSNRRMENSKATFAM